MAARVAAAKTAWFENGTIPVFDSDADFADFVDGWAELIRFYKKERCEFDEQGAYLFGAAVWCAVGCVNASSDLFEHYIYLRMECGC